MDDAARVRALREQGRIDDEQAERLLAALGRARDDEAAPPEGASPRAPVGPARAAAAATERAAAEPEPAARAGDPAFPGGAGAAAPGGAPGASAAGTARDEAAVDGAATRWARVELFAGSLHVEVDPELDAPRAEARDDEVEVVRDGDLWRITQRPRDGGSWIDRLVDGLRRTDLTLRLPSDTGIDLDVKAGDVDLRGVPSLRGRLLAGDLEATGVRAVDVALEAGDLELELDPAPGAHRVRMTVGDARVTLPRGADVAVSGRVNVGDADATEPLRATGGGLSGRVEGTLGAGTARLSIEVVTGDLDVVVR